jgi:hypothetical protein
MARLPRARTIEAFARDLSCTPADDHMLRRARSKGNATNRAKEMPMSSVEPNRRQLLQGLAATAPLAAILSDPELAGAVAAALEDVTLRTAGGRACTHPWRSRLPFRRRRYC